MKPTLLYRFSAIPVAVIQAGKDGWLFVHEGRIGIVQKIQTKGYLLLISSFYYA